MAFLKCCYRPNVFFNPLGWVRSKNPFNLTHGHPHIWWRIQNQLSTIYGGWMCFIFSMQSWAHGLVGFLCCDGATSANIILVNVSLVCLHKFTVIMCAFLYVYFFEKWATNQSWVGISFNQGQEVCWILILHGPMNIQTTSHLTNPNIHSTTLMSQLDFRVKMYRNVI